MRLATCVESNAKLANFSELSQSLFLLLYIYSSVKYLILNMFKQCCEKMSEIDVALMQVVDVELFAPR